jgi:uncharacterized protein (TIGR03083 family)
LEQIEGRELRMANQGGEPVVDLLEETWSSIGQLGDALGTEEWELPSECPGWSVRDVLAHMVGTESSLLGEDSPAPVSTADHVHNAVGARNEGWVASLRPQSGPALLDKFREVTSRRLRDLRSWPTERFDEVGPSPVGNVPYREFMQVRVMDCWVHEQDMRVATARPGHREGPAAELAVDRLVSAMPFVVGKQAGAPEGSSVCFELTGTPSRRVDVVVRDGRAAMGMPPETEPTTRVRMDSEVFWRLGCGRVTSDAVIGAGLVDVAGDEELARRVLGAMAFMI